MNSIVEYLKNIGCFPVKINSVEAWFISPFRNEKTASLKVNLEKNIWYDHGAGIGGNLYKLSELLQGTTLQTKTTKSINHNYSDGVSIISITNIKNKNLIEYLYKRKISKTFFYLLEEIHFTNNNKKYYSIAFKNNSNGYELRNKYYKSCFNTKDITTFKNNSDKLLIFEGFIDFLSFLEIHNSFHEFDYLILNSVSMVQKSMKTINEYSEKFLFLDNDNTGKATTELILKNTANTNDFSFHYKDYKDVNEYLIHGNRSKFRL